MVLSARLDNRDIDAERRGAGRRILRLEVPGTTGDRIGAPVVIHDISRFGMLIETEAELSPGAAIEVELPEVGVQSATIAWSRQGFFGCEYQSPIPAAAMSAALLKSHPVPDVCGTAEAPGVKLNEVGREGGKFALGTRLMIIFTLALASWAGCAAVYWWTIY
jgi:hypothetical protein